MEAKQQDARYLSPEEKGKYLTLKEASQLTDYTPDYLGQLIRQGKIEGFQVYTNVSWVTTERALREYMAGKGKIEHANDPVWYHDPHTYLRAALYVVIGCLVLLLVSLVAIVAVGLDRAMNEAALEAFEVRENE